METYTRPVEKTDLSIVADLNYETYSPTISGTETV